MFAFSDTGQTVKVPFGVGVKGSNANNGFIFTFPVNPFEIDVTPTTIAVEYTASGGVPPFGFPNNEQAIIKMTTTESSLINLVSLESQTGITLTPGAFLFGSNFFQVNLADASVIQPGQAWISQRATRFSDARSGTGFAAAACFRSHGSCPDLPRNQNGRETG